MVPSITASLQGCKTAKQPQIITLPPPCLTVGVLFMSSDVMGLKASKNICFCLVHPQNIISLAAHQDDFWQIHLYNNFKLLQWRILLLSGHIVQQINCCNFGLLLLLLLIVIRRKDSVSNLSFGRYTFGINFELHGSSFSATPPARPPSCLMTWWSDNNTHQPFTAEGQKAEGNSKLIWDHLNEMTERYCQQKILNSDKWKFYVYFSESVRIL